MDANLIRQRHGQFKRHNPSKITLKVGDRFSNGATYCLVSIQSHKDGKWNVSVFSAVGLKSKKTVVVMTEAKFLELKMEADMQKSGSVAHGMGKLPGIGTQHRRRQLGFHRATVFA